MVSDNSPALGWVRVTDAVVTYNNTIYVLPPDATVKKYVYWEAERPDRFNYSDVILPDSATRYLVLINDNGQHTVVHSKTDNFNIAFDKGVQSAIEKKLYGMYEEFKDEMGANETKFSNIVQTIDSIKLTVGEMKSTDTVLEERYTTLLETVKGLGVEVREKITTADTQNK